MSLRTLFLVERKSQWGLLQFSPDTHLAGRDRLLSVLLVSLSRRSCSWSIPHSNIAYIYESTLHPQLRGENDFCS